jgi:DNA-binding transcriptional regulator GbsR (MarR family)
VIANFFTRKHLTQKDLKMLTGLSAGIISESLNFLLKKELIILQKIKGIRVRRYSLPSIAYYNYSQLYQIFERNYAMYTKLESLYKNLDEERDKLSKIKGYKIIKNQVEEFLSRKLIIEKLYLSYKEAKEKFRFE